MESSFNCRYVRVDTNNSVTVMVFNQVLEGAELIVLITIALNWIHNCILQTRVYTVFTINLEIEKGPSEKRSVMEP
jgi:hypothetical protein